MLQSKPESSQWKTLQISPVAGFQYHHGATLWPQLATGQPLTLIREPGNRFDQRAVRIDWQGEKLGYIPAKDNAAVSQLLDRGEQLSALIVGLKKSNNPWERIEVEVRWRV
ncbi:MAG: HIRAN protein [Gammaproteobacteria bacterium]|nr:MAG: HIRAN protein [Gammaproteobacteria bacterium]